MLGRLEEEAARRARVTARLGHWAVTRLQAEVAAMRERAAGLAGERRQCLHQPEVLQYLVSSDVRYLMRALAGFRYHDALCAECFAAHEGWRRWGPGAGGCAERRGAAAAPRQGAGRLSGGGGGQRAVPAGASAADRHRHAVRPGAGR